MPKQKEQNPLNMSNQEYLVYKVLKAKKSKEGVAFKDLREALPDINGPRISDILRLLVMNKLAVKLSHGHYNALPLKQKA